MTTLIFDLTLFYSKYIYISFSQQESTVDTCKDKYNCLFKAIQAVF